MLKILARSVPVIAGLQILTLSASATGVPAVVPETGSTLPYLAVGICALALFGRKFRIASAKR